MKNVATLGAMLGLLLASCTSHSSGPIVPEPQLPSTVQGAGPAIARPAGGNFPGFADAVAYAEYATLHTSAGIDEISGPIANASLACKTGAASDRNSVKNVSVRSLGTRSGTALDTITASRTATSGSVKSSSTVQGVSIMKGLITANVVAAVANSSATSASATSDAKGSELAGLVVAGVPAGAAPAPNTRIDLAGLGYVILNEQVVANNVKTASGATLTHIYVNMIHVFVTETNTLGIAVGTEVVVASAYSSFTVPPAAFQVNPTAYSLYALGVNNDIHASSGPWAIASVACNSLADKQRLTSATTPVGSAGTMVNVATASESASSTSVHANSNTASANLLSGLVVAQSLVADANVKRSGTSFTRAGSIKFVSLKVGGQQIKVSVAANTRIKLAGLGYAIVNSREGATSSGSAVEEVNVVIVHVTMQNKYNLAIGAEIVLGHAHAEITGF